MLMPKKVKYRKQMPVGAMAKPGAAVICRSVNTG
jgi:hypothetical protein